MSIEVENVTSGYHKGIPILKNVSMKVEKSKVTAVIGPNAAGKSTLLKTICGFLKPVEGRIRYDGHDITGVDPSEMIRRGYGLCYSREERFSEDHCT